MLDYSESFFVVPGQAFKSFRWSFRKEGLRRAVWTRWCPKNKKAFLWWACVESLNAVKNVHERCPAMVLWSSQCVLRFSECEDMHHLFFLWALSRKLWYPYSCLNNLESLCLTSGEVLFLIKKRNCVDDSQLGW